MIRYDVINVYEYQDAVINLVRIGHRRRSRFVDDFFFPALRIAVQVH
jgi:hypothetical protein